MSQPRSTQRAHMTVGLWERSGGNPADIPTTGTGRDQWTRAIRAIAKGATGAPSTRDLLDTMIGDYKRQRTT